MKPKFLSFLLVALCLWAFGCEESEESSDISVEDVEVSKDDVKEVTRAPDGHEIDEEEDQEDEEEVEECCTDEGCWEAGFWSCDTNTCECRSCCDIEKKKECLKHGMECDLESCMCLHIDPCFNHYCNCDPNEAPPAGFRCVEFEGEFVTMAYCDTSEEHGDPCPKGSVCVEEHPGEGGACWPSTCEWGGCTEGKKCVPAGNQAFFCTEMGKASEGEACSAHQDCGPGLLCNGRCVAPDCEVDDDEACSAPEECVDLSREARWGLGQCAQSCSPFMGSCPDGFACLYPERDPEQGEILGRCVEAPDPSPALGEACDEIWNPCEEGLTCDQPDSALPGVCAALCDPVLAPEGEGACAEDGLCIARMRDGVEQEIGRCISSCDPWSGSPKCEENERCMPSVLDPGKGQCLPEESGGAQLEAPCDLENPCAQRLYCEHQRCVAPCDPEGQRGCLEGEICKPILVKGDAIAIGSCAPLCQLDAQDPTLSITPCEDPELGCLPGGSLGLSQDYCEEKTSNYGTIWEECSNRDDGLACAPGARCHRYDEYQSYCFAPCTEETTCTPEESTCQIDFGEIWGLCF